MITIGIADDHAIIRESLRRYLSEHSDLDVVAQACNGKEALDLVSDRHIDVLLLDLRMPIFSGFDALAGLKIRSPATAILIFSALAEEHYAIPLLRHGVAGYLSKGCEPSDIVDAVRLVAQGKRYFSPTVVDLLAQQVMNPQEGLPHEQLSDRELQVFLRLAKGESVTGIGQALSLSPKTVTTYRTRMQKTLNLKTNSEATYYAVKHGLID